MATRRGPIERSLKMNAEPSFNRDFPREGCVDRAAAPRQEDRRRASRDDRPEGGRRVKGLRHGNQKGPIERNLKMNTEPSFNRDFPREIL